MTDLSLWQDAAVALVTYACVDENGKGRSKDDPVYDAWTEHRDRAPNRAHYSSCGDLGHGLLERLGLDESWINRSSLGHYRIGWNVTDLSISPIHSLPGGVDGGDWFPEAGDILEIWNLPSTRDAHVCVCLGPGSPGHVKLGNYGAGGMSAAAYPGSNISDTPLTFVGGAWVLGHRKVQRVIRLEDAIRLAKKPPDLTGASVTDELIDALHATWSAA